MAHYEFSQPKIILIRTQVLVQPSLYILRLAAINVCETDFKVVQRAAVANRCMKLPLEGCGVPTQISRCTRRSNPVPQTHSQRYLSLARRKPRWLWWVLGGVVDAIRRPTVNGTEVPASAPCHQGPSPVLEPVGSVTVPPG